MPVCGVQVGVWTRMNDGQRNWKVARINLVSGDEIFLTSFVFFLLPFNPPIYYFTHISPLPFVDPRGQRLIVVNVVGSSNVM